MDRIDEMQPCTIEGAIVLIETSEDMLGAHVLNALAGLRAIAAGGVA